MRGEAGAAVVLVIVAATVLLTVGTMLGFVAAAFSVHRQAQAAADLAALAGAQTLARGGDACDAAVGVATANSGTLESCRVVAPDVLVSVRVDGPSWWGLSVDPVAEARAGAR